MELMIVVAILLVFASIGVPRYVSALRTARVVKAKHELVTIARAVDSYTERTSGQLPLSLYQVGFGGKRDPWGVPYCYFNYAAAAGEGFDWAVAAGIVDPSAFSPLGGSGGGGDDAPGGPQGIARVNDSQQLDRTELRAPLGRPISVNDRAAMDQSVKSNGNFSLFIGVPATTRGRDQYMFPLNTDYDLFSFGSDHQTATSLSESAGLHGVIRANNGGFFGLASNY